MSYWDRTDRIIREGNRPNCGHCNEPMVPEDDHGRFTCFCPGYRRANHGRYAIPQITEDLPDDEKAQIPPINRLDLPPTKAEAQFLDNLIQRTMPNKPESSD